MGHGLARAVASGDLGMSDQTNNQDRASPAIDVWRRRVVARAERLAHPNYGWCHRCLRPWAVTEPHVVPHSPRGGSLCFALCEDCWPELEPSERLPYYRELIHQWREDSIMDGEAGLNGQSWQSIEAILTANVLWGM